MSRADPFDRERLAAEKHKRTRAHHKGRNHWTNWRRRSMAKAARAEGAVQAAKDKAARRKWLTAVRAYWCGEGDHPSTHDSRPEVSSHG